MSKTKYVLASIFFMALLIPFSLLVLGLLLGPLGFVLAVPVGIIGGFVMAHQVNEEGKKKQEQAELAVAQKLSAGLPLNAKEQALLDEIKARAESKGASGNE